jgi:hypothetical protein
MALHLDWPEMHSGFWLAIGAIAALALLMLFQRLLRMALSGRKAKSA